MVTVEMAHHNRLDIRDLPGPRGSDSLGKSVYGFIPVPWAALHCLRAPTGDDVLAGARVEENKAYMRVVDQSGYHDQVATLMRLWCKADCELVASGEDVGCIQIDAAQVQELKRGWEVSALLSSLGLSRGFLPIASLHSAYSLNRMTWRLDLGWIQFH
jgi:hypothetical protein